MLDGNTCRSVSVAALFPRASSTTIGPFPDASENQHDSIPVPQVQPSTLPTCATIGLITFL